MDLAAAGVALEEPHQHGADGVDDGDEGERLEDAAAEDVMRMRRRPAEQQPQVTQHPRPRIASGRTACQRPTA